MEMTGRMHLGIVKIPEQNWGRSPHDVEIG
jgi:hypothetical protein